MKTPGEYATLLKSMKREWLWLWHYMLRYRLGILGYIVIGLAGTAMSLGTGLAAKFLIDAVVSHNSGVLIKSAVLAVSLSLLSIAVSAASQRIASIVSTRIASEVRAEIYDHIITARWEDVCKFHSGELLNRLEGDVSTVSGYIISFIPNAVTRLTMFVGCLAIVLYYDVTMAAIALISAPFLLLLSRFSAKMIRKYSLQSREINGRVLSYSEESIQNLQTIKAFDLTDRYSAQLRTLLSEHRRLRLAHDRFSLTLSACMSVIGLIVGNLCYAWSVFRLWTGRISFGTMTLFLQITGNLSSSFSALVSLAPTAITAATAAGRIMEITELPREDDTLCEAAGAVLAAARTSGIAVEAHGVRYTYHDANTPVLDGVSFCASPGETVALVGPSGEGKTTILRMLLGLISPNEGTILLRAGDAEVSASAAARRLCAYVPQSSAMFSGTVAENLRIAAPTASDADLERALRDADAWEFLSTLPDGIHTRMGERGYNFSEGQLQRLSIARALLCRAPLLILDEATSALDTATESRVLAGIMRTDFPRTCILTTHRPAILACCDKVYRVEDGHVRTAEAAQPQEP